MKHWRLHTVGWLSMLMGYVLCGTDTTLERVWCKIGLGFLAVAGICFGFLIYEDFKRGGPVRPA